MCGCRARAAARAAAAAAPRAVPTVAPRRIPRAPLSRAPPPPATMSVSILKRPEPVIAVEEAPDAPAPQPRGRFQRYRIQFRRRPVVVMKPPPPETLVIHDTKVWGPLLWRAIHTAAEVTDGRTEFADVWADFVFELQMSLPCPDCMQHYRAWVQAHPLMASVRQWWVDLHNSINARKGVAPWSLEGVAAVNVDTQAGRDAVAALAPMLGSRAHRVLVSLYDSLGTANVVEGDANSISTEEVS